MHDPVDAMALGRVDHAGRTTALAHGEAEAVVELAENVAHSTREQSSGLQDLNRSISNLDEVTQRNVAMFEETAASTNMLSQNVDALIAASSRLGAPPAPGGVGGASPALRAAG